MPTTTAAAPTRAAAPPLTLEERLALANLAMDDRLELATADMRIRTAHIETSVVPLTPTLQPEPESADPVAQLLRQARALVAAGWCTRVYNDNRGGYCLQGALAAADPTGRHAARAAHLLLAAITTECPHVEGLSRWNDQQASAGPVLRAFDNAISLADTRGI